MKKTEIAYLAGFFDGEGCVAIGKQKKSDDRNPTYALRVSISSSNVWIVHKIQFAFGGSIYVKLRTKGHNLDCWQWCVSGPKAMEFLKFILPYLHLKKPQAEIAIQFQKVRRGRGYQGKLTDAERAIVEAQYLVVKNMKRDQEKIRKKGGEK